MSNLKVQGFENNFIPLQQEAKAKVFAERQSAALPEEVVQSTEQAEQRAKEDPNEHKLEVAIEQANKTMETYNTELRFSIHKESGEIAIKVINTKDNSVIREIPPERVLDFVAHVKKILKKMLGVMIDKFI